MTTDIQNVDKIMDMMNQDIFSDRILVFTSVVSNIIRHNKPFRSYNKYGEKFDSVACIVTLDKNGISCKACGCKMFKGNNAMRVEYLSSYSTKKTNTPKLYYHIHVDDCWARGFIQSSELTDDRKLSVTYVSPANGYIVRQSSTVGITIKYFDFFDDYIYFYDNTNIYSNISNADQLMRWQKSRKQKLNKIKHKLNT